MGVYRTYYWVSRVSCFMYFWSRVSCFMYFWLGVKFWHSRLFYLNSFSNVFSNQFIIFEMCYCVIDQSWVCLCWVILKLFVTVFIAELMFCFFYVIFDVYNDYCSSLICFRNNYIISICQFSRYFSFSFCQIVLIFVVIVILLFCF